MATPRSVFLSRSPSIPRLHLSPPTPHIHRRPHVTTHRSRSEVSSSSSTFTTLRYHLAPHPPDVLFYFIIRPDLGELGWLPRRIYRETSLLPLSLPLFLFLPLLLSLSSPPRPPLASRLTEKLESQRRIRGSSSAAAAAARCALFSSTFATFSSKLIYN